MKADSDGLTGIEEAILPTMTADADMGRIVGVLVGYLDDSYGHPILHMTVAGYFSSLGAWKKFEKRSKRLFAKFELEQPFEAKHFANPKEQFKGWSVAQRLDFASQWHEIVSDTVILGVSRSVPVELYDTTRKKIGRNHQIPALVQCLNEILVALGKHDIWPVIEAEGLALVLEQGNKSNEGALRWFNERKAAGVIPDHIRSLSIAPKTRCHAIQLADYLAYYTRQFVDTVTRAGDGGSQVPMRAELTIATQAIDVLIDSVTGFEAGPRFVRSRAQRKKLAP